VIVTSRAAPNNIYHGGHRPGKDFIIEHDSKPYVDGSVFECFIRHRFIQYIMSMRTISCCSGAKAVLVMDNCSSYVTGETFRLPGENHVNIVIFAPHTTNVFQVLDLSFFRVCKTKDKFGMEQDDDNTFVARIHILVRHFHSVGTPETIRGNFVWAAFPYKAGATPCVPEFSRERMMESPGLRQVSELNVALERLSTPRQKARFGLVK
jgi:hypothetical protein